MDREPTGGDAFVIVVFVLLFIMVVQAIVGQCSYQPADDPSPYPDPDAPTMWWP